VDASPHEVSEGGAFQAETVPPVGYDLEEPDGIERQLARY
jgi:hypothetical protein